MWPGDKEMRDAFQSQPLVAGSVMEALAQHAVRRPDATALIHVEPRLDGNDHDALELSYADLLRATQHWANRLAAVGARQDGAIALLLTNTPAHYVLMLASGVVSSSLSLNPLQSVEYLAQLLCAAGADILVVPTPQDDEKLNLLGHAVASLCESRRKLTVLEIGTSPWPGAADVLTTNTTPLARLAIDPSDTAAWFHTGGTTGAPKLVRHSHEQQKIAAMAFAAAANLEENDRLANGLPLFHVAGAICSSRALWVSGGCVVNLSSHGFRNPAVIEFYWNIVSKYEVTIAGGVPTAVATVLEQPVTADISKLRCGYAGGAPCSASLQVRFADLTGRPLHIIYGMTECCGVLAVGRSDMPSPIGIIGPPGNGIAIEIRDSTGVKQPFGQEGEIWISGPTVSPSRPDAFIGGWMATGDRGRVTTEGLIVTGRLSDMIIRSGHNIDPAIIEDAAIGTGKVAVAAAIGQPDSYAGELPILFAVPSGEGVRESTDLLSEIREAIADRAAWPRDIYWVSSLPVTAVGKIDRKQLRADAIERQLRLEANAIFGDEDFDVTVGDPQGLCPTISIDWRNRKPKAEVTARLRAWAARHNMELI